MDIRKTALRIRTRIRTSSVTLLQLFDKLVPSENQRLFALTIIIGAVCGLAAVSFHLFIKLLEAYFINRALTAPYPSLIFWTITTPTLGGLLCGILLWKLVPGARGSGIPEVKAAFVLKRDRIPFGDVIGKFFVGAIQIGTGSSLGREGPTVQICAGIASAVGKAGALSRQNLRRLLPVGAAAGIAAAFNAPIAAVTFTIEEIIGTLDQTILSGVIVAAALASVIERNILGEHPALEVLQVYGFHHASSLILYTVLGVISGALSVLFTDGLTILRGWFQRTRWMPKWIQPAIGGAVTGILAVGAILWLQTTGVTGGGYETLSVALAGKLTIKILVALGAMKFIATIASYSSGGAGGIFAPALFIGSMIGGVVGYIDVSLLGHASDEIGAFALVGMGAFFAGVIRAPITSVLIIIEMTGGYSLILPLMIANMISYGLSSHWRPLPIYEAFLAQDGIHLPHGQGASTSNLDQIKVRDAMNTKRIVSLRASMTAAEAFELIAIYDFTSFPVLDEADAYIGMITESKLRRMLADGTGGTAVRDVCRHVSYLSADDTLTRAVIFMKRYGTRKLVVVDQTSKNKMVGIVTMSDIIRVQTHSVIGENTVAMGAEPNSMT